YHRFCTSARSFVHLAETKATMSVFEIRLDDHASSKRKARRRSASVPDASEPVPENQPARLADDELDPALRPKRLEDFSWPLRGPAGPDPRRRGSSSPG